MSTTTITTIAYDAGHAAAAQAPVAAQAGKRKGWFARAVARVIAARQKRAMEEIRRHGIVLPRELDQAEWKVSGRGADSLPFQR